jgi:hypothetical protein
MRASFIISRTYASELVAAALFVSLDNENIRCSVLNISLNWQQDILCLHDSIRLMLSYPPIATCKSCSRSKGTPKSKIKNMLWRMPASSLACLTPLQGLIYALQLPPPSTSCVILIRKARDPEHPKDAAEALLAYK